MFSFFFHFRGEFQLQKAPSMSSPSVGNLIWKMMMTIEFIQIISLTSKPFWVLIPWRNSAPVISRHNFCLHLALSLTTKAQTPTWCLCRDEEEEKNVAGSPRQIFCSPTFLLFFSKLAFSDQVTCMWPFFLLSCITLFGQKVSHIFSVTRRSWGDESHSLTEWLSKR